MNNDIVAVSALVSINEAALHRVRCYCCFVVVVVVVVTDVIPVTLGFLQSVLLTVPWCRVI